jgi:hypothetical protein
MFIKLTDIELVMLSAAAQRVDRCLIAPAHLKGTAPQMAANKLIAAGLVKEVKARAGAPVWRRDDAAGLSYALRLTAAGAKAIAVDDGAEEGQADRDRGMPELINTADASSPQSPAPESSPNEAVRTASGSRSAPRSGSKLAQVIDLLQRDRGATIDELIAATGWLAHTTRAALTGLRKRGYAVAINRSDNDRGSFYRIKAEGEGAPVVLPVEQPADPTPGSGAQRFLKPRARRAA